MEVETGGLKKFDYSGAKVAKMSVGEKKGIREAYARAGERKRREKIKRVLFWIVALLIVLGFLFFFAG
jgi:hypothetical protein